MTEEVVDKPPEDKPPEPTEVEKIAAEMGWDSEYEGDNAKSAKDFILYAREDQEAKRRIIQKQTRKLEDMDRAITDLKEFNDRNYKVEINRLGRELKRLKKEKAEAVKSGDTDEVSFIDEQIKDIEDIKDAPPPKKEPAVHPDFPGWQEKNTWYGTEKGSDAELTESADNYFEANRNNPDFVALPYKRKLKKVEAFIKKEFPDKFSKPAKPPAGGVEGGGKKKTSTKRLSLSDLPPEAQETAKRFARNKIMSIDEYLKEYKG